MWSKSIHQMRKIANCPAESSHQLAGNYHHANKKQSQQPHTKITTTCIRPEPSIVIRGTADKKTKSICSDSKVCEFMCLCFRSTATHFHAKSSGSKAPGEIHSPHADGCSSELRLDPPDMERCEYLLSRVVSQMSTFKIVVPTRYLQLPRN